MPSNIPKERISAALRQGEFITLRPSRGMAQSDVYLVTVDDHKIVVKDFNERHPIARTLMCRTLIKREIGVLDALADTHLVPATYGYLDNYSFAMEFLDGVSPDRENAGQWPAAFAQTQAFLEIFHDRGFSHNDFRRDNILILDNGGARFFDFASAIRKPQRIKWLFFPKTLLVVYLQRLDRIGLIKMKADLTGEDLSAKEQQQGQKPWLVRVLRDFWKKYINNPILRRFK